MIQDIYPYHLDNHFIPDLKAEEEDTLFLFSGEKVLCREEEEHVWFPRVKEYLAGEEDEGSLIYLFRVDGNRYFLSLEDTAEVPCGYEFTALRSLRRKGIPDKPLIFAAVTARHLNDWYRSCRYCGSCGVMLKPSDAERAMVCPSCGRAFYPRINPAVIVGVTNGEDILLTKYAGRNTPYYALIGGFTEIGETLEETVQREVMEETGLRVKNIRYYKSQPWGFAADILAGYYCEVDGNPTIHMDEHELKEAVWMPREKVPGQPDDFSLTNEMMVAFREGRV